MFNNTIQQRCLWLMLAVMPLTMQAQTTTSSTESSAGNIISIVMIIIAIVLAFVIWGMGQVLVALAKQLWDKAKKSGTHVTIMLLTLTLLSSIHASAQTEVTTATAPANYGGLSDTAFWLLSSIVALEVIVIFFMMFFIKRIHRELLPELEQKQNKLRDRWSHLDKKFFTRAVPVEKEADVMLDHDYDGIRELDNSLPPWWKYGFYVTIVVAVIYLFNFHVMGNGLNPTQEYEAEIKKANLELEAYASKNADKIDENNIQMPAKAGLEEGKDIFTSICWTCHGKMGEGGTGPNLTDDYWIHKGSIKDVYLSIKHGYPDKGMQAWEKNYSPKQINNLAGYIKTLHGTNPPNAKAAQGDLFVEDAVKTTIVAKDSTAKNLK